jgi:hypothetical protein
MIFDTMTYSVMTIVAIMSFIVILLTCHSQGRHNSHEK